MEELVCLRSVWQTLFVSASTFAIFALANWGIVELIELDKKFLSSSPHESVRKFCGKYFHTKEEKVKKLEKYMMFCLHALLVSVFPLHCLATSISNVVKVRMVTSWLQNGAQKGLDDGSIVILTLCPLYIQIPPGCLEEFPSDNCLQESAKCEMKQILNNVRPVRMWPAVGREKEKDAEGGEEEKDVGREKEKDAAGGEKDAASREKEKDVGGEKEKDAEGGEKDATVHYSAQGWCFELQGLKALKYRAALLSVGLAPEFEAGLSLLRARGKFQAVVTALQAGGCVVSVVERVVQRLGISPVEAIVTFLAILLALQLIVELYACGHYQHPLLLHLNHRQCQEFKNHYDKLPKVNDKQNGMALAAFGSFLAWLIISSIAMYYFAHYLHTHLTSALSALLFLLSQLPSALLNLNIVCGDASMLLATVCGMVLYACSVLVGVAATITDWKAFHLPTPHNWVSSIIPHLSS